MFSVVMSERGVIWDCRPTASGTPPPKNGRLSECHYRAVSPLLDGASASQFSTPTATKAPLRRLGHGVFCDVPDQHLRALPTPHHRYADKMAMGLKRASSVKEQRS